MNIVIDVLSLNAEKKKQNYNESNGELNAFLFRSICGIGIMSGTNKIWLLKD